MTNATDAERAAEINARYRRDITTAHPDRAERVAIDEDAAWLARWLVRTKAREDRSAYVVEFDAYCTRHDIGPSYALMRLIAALTDLATEHRRRNR